MWHTGNRKLVCCPCGDDARWYQERPRPEEAPEHAVCLLTDADFADNYCDACFEQAVAPGERSGWKRLDDDAS